MPATVCPNCLTRDLAVSVVLDGESCRRCGQVPDTKLTPREIRECLRAKGAR